MIEVFVLFWDQILIYILHRRCSSFLNKVERKGAMRGGFIDKRRSKLLGWRGFKSGMEVLETAKRAAKDAEVRLHAVEDAMSGVANKYAKSKVNVK